MPPGGVRDPVPGRSGQDGCFRGFWRPPAEWFDAGYSIPPWGPDFRDFPGGAGGPGRPGVSRIGELLNTVPGVHPGRAPGGVRRSLGTLGPAGADSGGPLDGDRRSGSPHSRLAGYSYGYAIAMSQT